MSDLARRVAKLAHFEYVPYSGSCELRNVGTGKKESVGGYFVRLDDLRALLAETREEEKPTDIGQTDLDPDGNLLPSQRHVRAACGHIFTRGELVDGLYCPLCLRHYQTGIPSPGPFAPPASAGSEGRGLREFAEKALKLADQCYAADVDGELALNIDGDLITDVGHLAKTALAALRGEGKPKEAEK